MFVQQISKIQVEDTYDVAVCGGGFAGISAALASARMGKKTVLIERQFILGGLGTAGLVTYYLPLCDGYGHQVSFGIAEELLRLSVLHGAESIYPENWFIKDGLRTEKDKRFEASFNPQLFAILAERLLLNSGVDILYGTYIVDVKVIDDKIEYLITENKSGKRAYHANSVVDATGDCDIAHFAEVPTINFKQGNILAAWYYSVGKDGYKLNSLGCCDIPEEEKNPSTKIELLVNRRFSGIDGIELSDMVCQSHQAIYNNFLNKRKSDPYFYPVTIATIPQIRMTRKIKGIYELSEKDMHTYFEDSIGMVSDWRKRGPVYEVPFRTLYNSKIKNLICAGRCTSVTEAMWDIMRVIPCCAVTGEAAGTAAAMSDDFSSLDITELQMILQKNGVVIHENK